MASTLIAHPGNGRLHGSPPRSRVLILDCDPETLGQLAAAVRSDPSLELVAGAPDGAGLSELVTTSRPDVVLVDSALGAEAIAALRTDWPQARYLALSTGDDASTLVAMLAAGAAGCVPKGVAAAAVAEAIRELSNGRVQLDSDIASWLFAQVAEMLRGDAAPAVHGEAERAAVIDDILEHRRFEMVFQPIVDLTTGTLVGVEALARFQTDERRSPDFWLREAEAVGLRTRLELELVREAVAQADRLPPGTLMTVNLSPAAVTSPDLRDVIPERHRGRLVVEITDHRQVDDYESLAESLSELRAAGLRVAVDDSGQGLSSLQQVLQLTPDFIKLNRTLVRDIDSDAIRRALAFALTSVAGRIGAAVVAEGIETAGELEALRGLGIAQGQGYLIARPQSLDEIEGQALALPDADGSPAVVISLPGRAGRTLHEAARAAFKLLGAELPDSSFFISQLDYRYRRFRIVMVSEGLVDVLEPGFGLPLAESLCYRMASGQGARLCNDVAADPLYGALRFQREADVASYVGVPLEIPGGPRLGSLCAISSECDRYDERSLELLQTVALVLMQALAAEVDEHGDTQAVDHLRRLACSDRLTHALNRPSFLEQLARDQRAPARERERRHVFHVSIPSFDAVQQQYGRAVAELVLKDVADAMASAAEPGDTIGRVGETAFASVLVNRPTPESAGYTRAKVAERLRDAFARRGVVIKVEAGLTPLGADAPASVLEAALGQSAPLL